MDQSGLEDQVGLESRVGLKVGPAQTAIAIAVDTRSSWDFTNSYVY